MSIHFSQERWDKIKADYGAWWSGKLDRHLVRITLTDAYPAARATKALPLQQSNVHHLHHTPDEIVDALDVKLGQCAFLGDAFPIANFSQFGPGVLSAFCGARLDNSSGNVWFFPTEEREIADIHVQYDPSNMWVRRIKDIYYAGIRRWGNNVALGLPDFGGVLDIAATFRGSENLLMDLYDDPDEVLRLCGEIEVAWYAAYEDFTAILRDAGIVYSYWCGLCSTTPSYVLQSDFAYMIGPDMFKAFALPTLQRDCAKLEHSMYHLDGIGQLAHLDDLLSIDALDALQWVYGDGQPSGRHWMDVYRKIVRAGKRFQLVGDLGDLRAVAPAFESGMYFEADISTAQAAAAGLSYDAQSGRIGNLW